MQDKTSHNFARKDAFAYAKAMVITMEKIASFKVDHRTLVPGVYLSRRDGDIDTYDIRFKKPNAGDYLSNIEMHSVEHMAATVLRNSSISDRVIYFGPMGCRTGFYLLVRRVDGEKVKKELLEAFTWIADESTEMFGMSEIECGNYRELSLEQAKNCIRQFLDTVNIPAQSLNYGN